MDRTGPRPRGARVWPNIICPDSAAKSKRTRIVGGGLYLAAGAALIGVGVAALNDADEEDGDILSVFSAIGGVMAVTLGGTVCLGGIFSLAQPHSAERRYERIRGTTDPNLREEACAEALEGLARKGKRQRTIRAVIFGALGLTAAFSSSGSDDSSSNLAAAASGGGLALLSLLVKSRAEKTYRAYLERKGVGLSPDLILGVGPHGVFRTGLSLDF